jgi:hypothetical protein
MTDLDLVARLAKEAYDSAQYPDFIEAVNIDAPIKRHNVMAKFAREFAALVAGECARIIEAQDVDPAFKGRMAWAVRDRFVHSPPAKEAP